jgi:chorismate mutase
MKLDTLREQLNALDRELLEIAARRQALATEIARVKGELGLPTRDFGREREVLMPRNSASRRDSPSRS